MRSRTLWQCKYRLQLQIRSCADTNCKVFQKFRQKIHSLLGKTLPGELFNSSSWNSLKQQEHFSWLYSKDIYSQNVGKILTLGEGREVINRHFNVILEDHELHYFPKSFTSIQKKKYMEKIGEMSEITAACRTIPAISHFTSLSYNQ